MYCLTGDLEYTFEPMIYIQTANGVADCNTRIRRYSPALGEDSAGGSIGDSPTQIVGGEEGEYLDTARQLLLTLCEATAVGGAETQYDSMILTR